MVHRFVNIDVYICFPNVARCIIKYQTKRAIEFWTLEPTPTTINGNECVIHTQKLSTISLKEDPMSEEKWLIEITPKNKRFNLNLKEVWRYRDLLILFVKRDVITLYKQTILGPLWYLIQPLFTSVIFTLIFNNLAGIGTGNADPFLFRFPPNC